MLLKSNQVWRFFPIGSFSSPFFCPSKKQFLPVSMEENNDMYPEKMKAESNFIFV